MPKNLPLAIARAVIVAGVIVFLFVSQVTVATLNPKRLEALSVPTTGISTINKKPEQSGPTDASSSPVAAIKAADATNPGNTGVYSIIWNNKKATLSIVLTVDYLPDATIAKTAQAQSEKAVIPATTAGSSTTHFNIAGLPNLDAAQIKTAKTASAPASLSDTIVFRYRNVILVLSAGGSVTVPTTQIIALAKRQLTLVKQQLPGFTLYDHKHPVGFSVLYFFGGVLVIVFAFDGVHWTTAQRERRIRHKERMARYHYHSRGAKVLKRKAATNRRR